jgi:hypothetical protein
MTTPTTSSASSGGIGFLGLLTIVFVTLKLLGKIDWSWWLVLLPLYGPVVILLGIAGAFFGVAGILNVVDKKQAAKRRRG